MTAIILWKMRGENVVGLFRIVESFNYSSAPYVLTQQESESKSVATQNDT